jgi:hypothetical protein
MNPDAMSRTKQDLKWILSLRRARSEILGGGLFGDPAWDILLELYAARLRGKTMKLTDLTTDAPPSTLARWAAVLEERGLVTGHLDPLIPSVLTIELSEFGALKMSRLLQNLGHLHPVG